MGSGYYWLTERVAAAVAAAGGSRLVNQDVKLMNVGFLYNAIINYELLIHERSVSTDWSQLHGVYVIYF